MQKTCLITLILLLVFTGLSAHKQEMHQFITREAFELLKMQFPENFIGLEEIENYLGYDETTNSGYCPSIGREFIVAGAWMEDEYDIVYHYGCYNVPNYNNIAPWVENLLFGNNEDNRSAHTSISHFWNADDGENSVTYLTDTISNNLGQSTWEFSIAANAMKKMRKYANGDYIERRIYPDGVWFIDVDPPVLIKYSEWNLPGIVDTYNEIGEQEIIGYLLLNGDYVEASGGLSLTNNGKERAYNRLGRMCHLLQDMTVPAHVHCTSHAGVYGMYADHFEENELDYLNNHHYWSAAEVYNEVGRFIDPYIYEDPLYFLMYTSAQITDFFADGRKDGDDSFDISIPGLLDYMSSLEGPQESWQVNDESCRQIFDQVIPQAIRATAGLMYWFAIETGQIEPIPLPWTVSGNVQLADNDLVENVKVLFINENGSTSQTSVDNEGNFSKTFYFENTGNYEIVYQKDDYYPVHFENIEITEELLMPEVELNPILDEGFVHVSKDLNFPGFYYIQDAVDYMQYQGDGLIIIREGTYTGNKNKNIHWYPASFDDINNSVHLHIYAPSGHNVVIDCENSGCAFLFDEENFGLGFHYTNADVIENIKIVNAEQGIIIKNGSPKIINNSIENCHDFPYTYNTNGVAISCFSDALIQGNSIKNNVGNWVGLSPEQSTFGGGIYVNNQTSGDVIIRDNLFENCSAQEGGAIYATGIGSITIDNNDIVNNTLIPGELSDDYPGEGTALYLENCFDVNITNNLISYNQKPVICGDNTVFIAAVDNLNFRNNTVACNHDMRGLKIVNNDLAMVQNNAFYDNSMAIYCPGGSNTIIEHCSFFENDQVSYVGNAIQRDCYNCNPKFIDPENNNFTPRWDVELMSFLIDFGAEEYLDPDQTNSNIGSEDTFIHDHILMNLSNNYHGNRYRWVSFPVLDREITEDATMMKSVLDFYLNLYQQNFVLISKYMYYNWYIEWDNGDLELDSKEGYKIYSSAGKDLSVSGQKLPDNAVIPLHENQKNWVGYFIKKTMAVDVALASIWDHVISVASEDWFIAKDGVYTPQRCPMIYGKMYEIKVDADCELIYCDGPPVNPKERSATEGFVFDEKADYVPIVISGINDPEVEEVGILLDGQCIGATKIEEETSQILAYPPDELRGEGEIAFQFFTSERELKDVEKYSIYDTQEGVWISGTPQLQNYQMLQITFGDIPDKPKNRLAQNYPNPFNPDTKISYSIAKDGVVQLSIFNLKGQKVITLIDEFQVLGTHEAIWNGKDEAGKKVTSGIYFYRIKSGNYESTKKMLLIK